MTNQVVVDEKVGLQRDIGAVALVDAGGEAGVDETRSDAEIRRNASIGHFGGDLLDKKMHHGKIKIKITTSTIQIICGDDDGEDLFSDIPHGSDIHSHRANGRRSHRA
jgi:hypothetical protein